MTRAKFLELVIEKIVLAAFVGAASLAVLYSYNLYSRGFESSAEQSRAFSVFSIRTRDEILTASGQLRSILAATFYRAVDMKTNPAIEIYARFAQLDSALNVLANLRTGSEDVKANKPDHRSDNTLDLKPEQRAEKNQKQKSDKAPDPKADTAAEKSTTKAPGKMPFPNAYAAAKSMRDKFQKLISEYDRKEKLLNVSGSFEEKVAGIDQSQGLFVAEFSREMASVMATEFQEFHNRYFENVPAWGRPAILPVLAGGAFLLVLLAYALLPKTEKRNEYID
jgi:hypothetical protein